jgi:hypothetical protein
MVTLLQAFLRLILVALAAIGAWAGVELDLPGAPTEAERHEAAAELREHTADVFARIEEVGIADTPEIPSVAEAPKAATPAPTTTPPIRPTPAPIVTVVAPTTPAPAPAVTAPAPSFIAEPDTSWIESKLPETLFDPVDGAAREAAENIDDSALAKKTTVNLACVRKEGSALRITAGSGVVISPDGLIATDAHVAYFFLLGEDGVGCSITHPSFPIFGYPGQVVYVSPDWVRENPHTIGGQHTTATGEEDYAFVSFAPGSAPTLLGALPFVPVSTDEPVAGVGDEVVVAGYPGAAATPEGYGSASRLKVDEVSVADLDSFGRAKTADVIQIGKTAVAESGSSGGGVFGNGELLGLIVTTYQAGSGRGLYALSTAWIDRDLRADAGVSITDLVAEDPDAAAASFWAEQGEDLADLVREALD